MFMECMRVPRSSAFSSPVLRSPFTGVKYAGEWKEEVCVVWIEEDEERKENCGDNFCHFMLSFAEYKGVK